MRRHQPPNEKPPQWALWPGDGVFCVKARSERRQIDLMFLVDREDRTAELRTYIYGTMSNHRWPMR